MFKVPTDADNPSYDSTFTVSFRQWLTSSAADRKEWQRRKNAAIATSRSVRAARARAEQAGQKAAEAKERRANGN